MQTVTGGMRKLFVRIPIFILFLGLVGPSGTSHHKSFLLFGVDPVFAAGIENITDVSRKICPPPIVYQDSFTPRGDAFNNPETFARSIADYFDHKETGSHDFYVAISSEDYRSQGGTGCPWDLVWVNVNTRGEPPLMLQTCPYGDDDSNDGRSYEKPFASFKHALTAMKEHKEANRLSGHYTLYIRGSEDPAKSFYYTEPLYIGTYKTSQADYTAPLLYDMYRNPVKLDSDTGEMVFKDCDASYGSLSESTYIVANITVKPYNKEHVVLNGGCEFTYDVDCDGNPIEPGHDDWKSNNTVMSRDCGDYWPDSGIDGTMDNAIFTDNTFGMVTVRYGYNISVEGLHVINSPSYGIRLSGGRGASVVSISGNEVDNAYSTGIRAEYGHNYLIDKNTVKRTAANSKLGGINFSDVENFAVINNVVTQVYNDAAIGGGNDVRLGSVSDNVIYDNDVGTSIYINGTLDGLGAVRYESNIIHDNPYAQCFQLGSEGNDTTGPGSLNNLILTNNICYNNLHGIWLGGYCQADDEDTNACLEVFGYEDPTPGQNDCCGNGVPMSKIHVMNNTVWGNGVDADGFLLLGGENPYVASPPVGYGFRISNLGASNVLAINNIFAENLLHQTKVEDVFNSDGTLDTSKLLLENNIIYCRGGDADGDGNLDCLKGYISSRDFQVDPLFVDRMHGNLHLKFSSPAVDSGISVLNVPPVDFEDDSRVCIEVLGGPTEVGRGCPDIGADEYRSR